MKPGDTGSTRPLVYIKPTDPGSKIKPGDPGPTGKVTDNIGGGSSSIEGV